MAYGWRSKNFHYPRRELINLKLMDLERLQRKKRLGWWGDGVIAPKHVSPSSTTSFVECNGALFEEYSDGRVWFVVCESGMAMVLLVLSAVSQLSTNACNVAQIAGAAVQKCALPVLVLTRPHRKARAFLLGVVIESFGFVGGLWSTTTSIAGDPWGDAANVALQIQLYAGVALMILDGLHTGRIRDTLRRWLGDDTGMSPTVLFPHRRWMNAPVSVDASSGQHRATQHRRKSAHQ